MIGSQQQEGRTTPPTGKPNYRETNDGDPAKDTINDGRQMVGREMMGTQEKSRTTAMTRDKWLAEKWLGLRKKA